MEALKGSQIGAWLFYTRTINKFARSNLGKQGLWVKILCSSGHWGPRDGFCVAEPLAPANSGPSAMGFGGGTKFRVRVLALGRICRGEESYDVFSCFNYKIL